MSELSQSEIDKILSYLGQFNELPKISNELYNIQMCLHDIHRSLSELAESVINIEIANEN
jgi:hypothetical protein